MDGIDALMQLLPAAFPGESPPISEAELRERLAFTERELFETKRALCDLIAWVRGQGGESEEVNAILNRYDQFLRTIANAESSASDLIEQIDRLIAKGDDLAALRLYRQQTQVVWDCCHHTIEQWSRMSEADKRRAVLRDLKQGRIGLAKP